MAPTDHICRDYGPNPCPDDIVLLTNHTEGVTALPRDSFRIISQDTSSVMVQFNQKYDMSVPFMFYQYKPDNFNDKCYNETQVPKCKTIEITIKCMMHTPIALLEVWIADPLNEGLLGAGDNATIPDCCKPGVTNNGYVTKHVYEFKCESACPSEEY